MNKKEKKKHLIHLAFWTWSWVLTLAIATFGPEFFWEEKSALTIVAIVVNLPIGILMVLANRKLFNHFKLIRFNYRELIFFVILEMFLDAFCLLIIPDFAIFINSEFNFGK